MDDGHIYLSSVVHTRFAPVRHGFRYRVGYLLLDIDRLSGLDQRLRLFAWNRAGLFSIHNRDHGPRDGSALRPWIEQTLREHGVEMAGGRVRLLCFPRILGYAFNPVSLWYCDYPDGRPAAVLCEVRNTFGEYHNYLLPPAPGGVFDWQATHHKSKCFHVSPFLGNGGNYAFRVRAPGQRLSLHIREFTAGQAVLAAGISGHVRPLEDADLLRLFVAMPLMTFRIFAMIHWQALKLWWRGVPVYRKPPPPRRQTS